MSLLSKLKSQPNNKSYISMYYGVAGVGKTELTCKLHGLTNTAYLNLEKGWHKGIDGVQVLEREDFPLLKDLYAFFEEMKAGKHKFKSIVIDSLTALQYYFYAEVMEAGQQHIDSLDYSKSHKKATEEAKKFMMYLQDFKTTGIEVIIVAHSSVQQMSDPRLSAPYNVYKVDTLYKDMTEIVVKLCDNVGFCYYATEQSGKDGKHKIRVNSDETDRVTLFEFRAFAPDAKNRLGLPAEVNMDKDAINLKTALLTAQPNKEETLEEIKKMINELLKQTNANTVAAVEASLKLVKAGDIEEFKRIKNKLLVTINAEKGV